MDDLIYAKMDQNHWCIHRIGGISLIKREGNEYLVACRSIVTRKRYNKRHKSFSEAFKTALSYRAIVLEPLIRDHGWFERLKSGWYPEYWDTLVWNGGRQFSSSVA